MDIGVSRRILFELCRELLVVSLSNYIIAISVISGAIMNKIQKIKIGNLTWVDIKNPTSKEIDYLKKNFNFHILNLDDCLSIFQRPKIDEYPDHLFIVLHFPVFDFKKRILKSSEIDIFISKDYLITLHDGNLNPLNILFEDCLKNKKECITIFKKGSGYLLYKVIDKLTDNCFPILDKIAFKIERIEDQIFKGQTRKMVEEISIVKRNILNYRKIIKPQRAVIADLESDNKEFLPSKLDVYFDDILDHFEKIWYTLENYKELIDGLQETNESLITHKINDVMKILTIFSVIFLPLTLLSGIYGMNLKSLPLAEHSLSFWIILIFMLVMVFGMLYYFKKKKWL